MSKSNIKVSYDDFADVMYITADKIKYTKNREEEAGLVLRYDMRTQQPVGATIIDFREYWLPKRKQLVNKLAKFFGITNEAATKLVEISN